MERYLGLDAHGQSCTFGVLGPTGRRLRHDVVETNGAALVQYVKSLPGRKHLCLEEGTQSAWLYEILSPHVEEIVVVGLHDKSRGPKDDLRDAFQRAEELRTNQVQTSVFKAPRSFASLRELSRRQRGAAASRACHRGADNLLPRIDGLGSPRTRCHPMPIGPGGRGGQIGPPPPGA